MDTSMTTAAVPITQHDTVAVRWRLGRRHLKAPGYSVLRRVHGQRKGVPLCAHFVPGDSEKPQGLDNRQLSISMTMHTHYGDAASSAAGDHGSGSRPVSVRPSSGCRVGASHSAHLLGLCHNHGKILPQLGGALRGYRQPEIACQVTGRMLLERAVSGAPQCP